MSVLDAIKNVADGADAVKRIHDTGEYFTSKYIRYGYLKFMSKHEMKTMD